MNMEGSSVRSGGVLKKKNSSGCLIIKQKSGIKKSGGGLRDLSDYNEKKRPRLVASDSTSSSSTSSRTSTNSSSSDEDESLEFMRRKANEKRLHNNGNGSTGRKRDEFENKEFDRNGIEIGGEKKRSKLDLFEFDEYDEFDGYKMVRRNAGGNMKEFGVGSSGKFVAEKQRKGSSSVRNQKFELDEEDEAHMPISLLKSKYKETSDKAIRVQGKNGVLKVMVNKKRKTDFPSRPKNYENRGLIVDKEKSVEKDKGKVKLEKNVKPILNKASKARDSEIDVDCSSKKRVKKEEKRSPSPEKITPVKGKAKRGGSTEKQMLREKIRGMLLDAGWTIDLRPRRNRDYLDSVYINPSGTAYWSIVKAYDAFKKQSVKDNGKTSKSDDESPSFAPLSEDLLNKLTRQTKKKIEREMRRKRKEDDMQKSDVAESSESDQNDERLSSYVKKNCSKSNVVQGRTSKVIGRCTLLVRGSEKGENSDSDGYIPYSGKRTVLAWLIDSGTAQLSEKVQYMNRRRTKVMLEGWITRDGIHCGCCSKILAVSKFELHAGSKLRQPFQNIFLESGSSLLQCQIDAWNKQEESVRRDFFNVDVDGDEPDDDTCGICGDGGDLICCDSCPSTFHQICLEIKMLPSGDWHCPNCTCKFCGLATGNVADENDNDSTGDELNKCSFCEKKYHKSCSERVCALPVSSDVTSFCGMKCQELYDHLQKNLGVKNELEAGFSWSVIQRSDVSDTSDRRFSQRVECNSKLAVALSVMDECFLPIIDRRSEINMIHNVVYNCGSNFNRLNYRGFYTAILERGDEIIAAASIRFHGTRLAEMPFIGTREIYRRQGMCRRLLSAIETELSSLKVGQLVIPAISEHMNTWTTAFGFHELENTHKKEIKSMNMVVFPGTDMLKKQLVEQEIPDVGMKISESTKNKTQSPVLVEKSDIDSSLEHNKDSEASQDSDTSDDEVETIDSGPHVPAIPSNDPELEKNDEIDPVDSGSPKPAIHSNDTNNEADTLGASHESNTNKEVDLLVSGSPAPAIPSNGNTPAISDSDVLVANGGITLVVMSEVECKQKEESVSEISAVLSTADKVNGEHDKPGGENKITLVNKIMEKTVRNC